MMDYYFIHWYNDLGEDESKFFRFDQQSETQDFIHKLRKRGIEFSCFSIHPSDEFSEYKASDAKFEF